MERGPDPEPNPLPTIVRGSGWSLINVVRPVLTISVVAKNRCQPRVEVREICWGQVI